MNMRTRRLIVSGALTLMMLVVLLAALIPH